jgi:hypothetical protein
VSVSVSVNEQDKETLAVPSRRRGVVNTSRRETGSRERGGWQRQSAASVHWRPIQPSLMITNNQRAPQSSALALDRTIHNSCWRSVRTTGNLLATREAPRPPARLLDKSTVHSPQILFFLARTTGAGPPQARTSHRPFSRAPRSSWASPR